jgi:hypothetical protein
MKYTLLVFAIASCIAASPLADPATTSSPASVISNDQLQETAGRIMKVFGAGGEEIFTTTARHLLTLP